MKHTTPTQKLTQLIVLCLIFTGITTAFARPVVWRPIAPGLEYSKMAILEAGGQGSIHAFRIDLNQYQLHLTFAKDYQRDAASVKTLAEYAHALLAINGGFFSPAYQPLGLRIQAGKVRAPLKNTRWWGIFYIQDNRPYIVSQRQYHYNRRIQFAVQSGPRLVINGRIPNLKHNFDERSAVGITTNGKIILAATENVPITTRQLADIFKRSNRDGGYNCPNAINLDGGSSSQLYARMPGFSLHVPNFSAVTDAITVTPIQSQNA